MNLSHLPEIQKLIDERVRSGQYRTPEDVVAAGLAMLRQQEHMGDFAPGELDELLAVADGEIERGELLDGATVFSELRELGKTPSCNAQDVTTNTFTVIGINRSHQINLQKSQTNRSYSIFEFSLTDPFPSITVPKYRI